RVSSGTEIVPPPMPTMELKKPIEVPITVCPVLPGRAGNNADFPVLNSMFNADKVAMTPNNTVSHVPSARVTSQLPARTPIRINRLQRFNRSTSTLPFCLCERIELIDVGTMVARQVAVATSIADSGETQKPRTRQSDGGTTKSQLPPPTGRGSLQAKKPVAIRASGVGKW